MNLKNKITLLITGGVVVLLMTLGAVAIITNYNITEKEAVNKIEISARLASGDISARMKNYMNIANVVGTDGVISGDASDEEKVQRMTLLAEMYEFTSGNILDENGMSLQDGTDFSDREYVKKALSGETNVSDITLSKYTNKYGFSVASPVKDESGNVKGVVYFRMDIDFINHILENMKISENGYAYIVNGEGVVIAHHDEELINNENINDETNGLEEIAAKMTESTQATGQYEEAGELMFCGYSVIENTDGWKVVVAAPDDDFKLEARRAINVQICVDIAAIILGGILASVISGYVSKPVIAVKETLVRMSQGEFTYELAPSDRKDEIGVLVESTRSLEETLSSVIGEANGILGSIADLDLRVEEMKVYPGEFDSLAGSVNIIRKMLIQIIASVQEAAGSVGSGSSQLAQAAAALSNGTLAQANSIQQIVNDIDDVTERVNASAENERVVNEKLKNLDEEIKQGNEEMTNLLHIVEQIEEMSNDIQKIVETIDTIAFQTNILALNASVEAARAGDSGKGFSVVADEVGSLAGKCGDASKKTAELIENCINAINKAKKNADKTFDSFGNIVKSSEEISARFEEISEAIKVQADKTVDIQNEMSNVSDVVQTNTATAQETAASTQVLSEESRRLSDIVQRFKL